MHRVEVSAKQVKPGLCEVAAQVDHRLSIHRGDPVPTVRWEGKPRQRHLRVPGGLNVVPAGVASRWFIEAPMEQLVIRIPQQTLTSVAQDMGLDRAHLRSQYRDPDPRIEHIAQALHLETHEGGPNGPIFAEGLAVALCAQLIRDFSQREPIASLGRQRLSSAQFARVIEYIDANLDTEGLTLRRLSEVAGLGVSSLRTSFAARAGRPVHRYIVERRVEYAAKLLAQGAPISDAAMQAGFSHASHMARWMRRLMYVAPHELRER
jgi:AraC family transcriptional regulator